jgi:4-amino-4-deoxy-L-arabinose transferase-like glycosyltransferase
LRRRLVALTVADERRFPLALTLIGFGALVGRVAYVVYVRALPMHGDGVAYHWQALLLADGKGFISVSEYLANGTHVASATHPPVWPLVLAMPTVVGLRTFLEHQLFACMIGTATVVVIGLTGRRLANARAGMIAAGVAAIYPYTWLYERALLSETLVLFGVALAIYLAVRFRAEPSGRLVAALGAACGMLALTRSELALLVPLLLVPLVLTAYGVPMRRRASWLAAAVVLAGAVVAPWAVYNATRFDHPAVLSTQFGELLRNANCDTTYHGELAGFIDRSCTWQAGARGPAYIGENATQLPRVVAAREGRMWNVWRPAQQMQIEPRRGIPRRIREGAFFAFDVLVPFAIAGLCVLRARGTSVWPLLVVVAVPVITAVIAFGYTRYRAPAEPPLLLASAVAIDALLARFVASSRPARHRAWRTCTGFVTPKPFASTRVGTDR